MIQVAKEFGVGLVTTADSHYPNPDAWKTESFTSGLVGLVRVDHLGQRKSRNFLQVLRKLDMSCIRRTVIRCGKATSSTHEEQGFEYDDDLGHGEYRGDTQHCVRSY